MMTPEGRDLWMMGGASMSSPYAKFDLAKNSRSQRTLALYDRESEKKAAALQRSGKPPQTPGVGREIFSTAVENATKHGFKIIDTHAAGYGKARDLLNS